MWKGGHTKAASTTRAGFPELLLQGGCLSVTHLEEVEDVVCVQPVVTEAVENLHSGAQGQVLEAGLPQRVGLPFLQLPAVIDDVLQVAVEGLRPSQWSQTQRCVNTTQRIGGWGWGALGADTSSTVPELKAPEGPASPSRKRLLLHHVLGADPVKSQRLPMFKQVSHRTGCSARSATSITLRGSSCTCAVSMADTARGRVDRHLYRQTRWSSRGIQFTRADSTDLRGHSVQSQVHD